MQVHGHLTAKTLSSNHIHHYFDTVNLQIYKFKLRKCNKTNSFRVTGQFHGHFGVIITKQRSSDNLKVVIVPWSTVFLLPTHPRPPTICRFGLAGATCRNAGYSWLVIQYCNRILSIYQKTLCFAALTHFIIKIRPYILVFFLMKILVIKNCS